LLFGEVGANEHDVFETVQKRIKQLTQAANSPMGWKSVFDDFEAQDLCLIYKVFTI
jgi:hypothetical protein